MSCSGSRSSRGRRQPRERAPSTKLAAKAPNGEIIAASQGYESKANAETGIEAIKTHAPGAKVEDHS
ncbi:MAG TPA: YegP family protein [Mycobacterium sp.]|nr:YegP family protein [Mycobacterium sp.]